MTGKTKAVIQPKKDVGYVWICDYCKMEFETRKKCDLHEKNCPKRNIKIDKSSYYLFAFIVFVVLAFLIGNLLTTDTDSQFKLFSAKPTLVPTPTVDPDPYMTCSWNKDKNGEETCPNKRMRKSECDDSICCYLGNSSYSSMSKVECARLQAELDSKKPVYVQQVAPIKIDIPKMPGPQNVSCNFDLGGNWVCRPSW